MQIAFEDVTPPAQRLGKLLGIGFALDGGFDVVFDLGIGQLEDEMKGLVWCFALVGVGIPLALLGLLLDSERLMALGGGAIATVVVGWPVLVLMGAVQTSVRR